MTDPNAVKSIEVLAAIWLQVLNMQSSNRWQQHYFAATINQHIDMWGQGPICTLFLCQVWGHEDLSWQQNNYTACSEINPLCFPCLLIGSTGFECKLAPVAVCYKPTWNNKNKAQLEINKPQNQHMIFNLQQYLIIILKFT